MKIILLIILIITNGCTTLFNAGGLMHSIATNNTVSTVLSLGDTAVKEKTGKSVSSHLLGNFFNNKDRKSKNKDIEWIFK